jgi:hypothetical protein
MEAVILSCRQSIWKLFVQLEITNLRLAFGDETNCRAGAASVEESQR